MTAKSDLCAESGLVPAKGPVPARASVVDLVRHIDVEAVVLGLLDRSVGEWPSIQARLMPTPTEMRRIWVEALESRPGLFGHSEKVAQRAEQLGNALGLKTRELHAVTCAAELHDIGKVAIPIEILDKPGQLDESEWELLRTHTLIGERIVRSVPALAAVASLIRSSHERWDGAGYPDRIAGEDIPLGSRIIFLCDSFDAMTTDRPYQRARTRAEALTELRDNAGSQFDPELVGLFCATAYSAASSSGLSA